MGSADNQKPSAEGAARGGEQQSAISGQRADTDVREMSHRRRQHKALRATERHKLGELLAYDHLRKNSDFKSQFAWLVVTSPKSYFIGQRSFIPLYAPKELRTGHHDRIGETVLMGVMKKINTLTHGCHLRPLFFISFIWHIVLNWVLGEKNT